MMKYRNMKVDKSDEQIFVTSEFVFPVTPDDIQLLDRTQIVSGNHERNKVYIL